MKKLIIACCAVLTIGGCMAIGGWAAGGQLYSSYYNGALHSVTERVANAAHHSPFRYRFWLDDYGWHSGWFDDDDDIDDTLDDMDDTLDDIDYGYLAQEWSNRTTDPNFPVIPRLHGESVHELEFTLQGGDISIQTGDDFALDGTYSILASEIDESNWELRLSAGEDGATIFLPDLKESYESISITVLDSAAVDIAPALRAHEINLHTDNGTIDTDLLSASELELTVHDGALYGYLEGSATDYHVDAKTAAGSIRLNDQELAGAGRMRYDNRKALSTPIASELEISVTGSGTVELNTME